MLARFSLTPTARLDEEEKTRVGRRARPPTLLQLVLLDSDATAGVDPSLRRRATVSAFAEDRLEVERASGAPAAALQNWYQQGTAMWRGSSTPGAAMLAGLPLHAKRGSLAETAAWATKEQRVTANGRRLERAAQVEAIRREVRGLWAKRSEAERYRARVIAWSPMRKRRTAAASHQTGVPPIVPIGLKPSAMLRHHVQARRCRRRDRTC